MRDNVVLEAKGRLTSQDRKKMLLVKEQHPDKIIVMIFGSPGNTLSKKSRTTYAAWCENNGIAWTSLEEIERNPQWLLTTIRSAAVGKPKTSPMKKRTRSSKLRKN